MSFAIEVPGDSNPLTHESLCRVLEWATSNNMQQRQEATQQLSSWELQPGYYSSLQRVFLDKSIPHAIRFLSIIQLKNGIDRYWRLYATAKNGIKQPEKAQIRTSLFQGTVEEEDHNLALQNALAVAKVIRIDYPAEWPEALPSLITMLREQLHGNPQHLFGGLLIVLRVVKELSSARLRKSQTALQGVTPELVYVLGQIYGEKSTQWTNALQNGQQDANEVDVAMQTSLLALRTLRRLVTSGFERPHTDTTVQEFWKLSQTQFGSLLGFIDQGTQPANKIQDMIGKHLLQFAKLHIMISENHPASFAVLPDSLPLVRSYWDLVAKFASIYDKSDGIRQSSEGSAKAKTEGPLLEKLALKGLLLLRACIAIAFRPVQTFKYRSPEMKEEQEKARELIKVELLQESLVLDIVKAIISHLFVFRKADLEAWEEDAEDWEQQEASESNAYEWAVRPCAEKLFLDLLTYYKDLLVPPLLEYFQSAQAPGADVATKEAVYTAMGLSAAHVVNRFDFDSVLTTTMVNDVQQTGGLYKVLRRRIAITISKWAPVKLSEQSRPVVYQIFHHFLNPTDETNDLVVQITAARELGLIAEDLDFNIEAFLPHTSDILSQMVNLIENVGVDETKLALLESIRILVTRMEGHVAQFGDQIMTILPGVWERSGNQEFMIKQAVIAIFTALVTSMGEHSQRYQHLMVPLLSEAARPGSELHEHLIDEALELWNAILMQTSAPVPAELVNMAELLLPLLQREQHTAREALGAIEAYILITPQSILEDSLRRPTLTALAGTLDAKARDQVSLGTTCIEYLIRSATELGGSSGVDVIIQDMVETEFMKNILESLHDAWECHQTTGPNRKVSKLNTVTQGDYFSILARLALAEPTLFTNMLAKYGSITDILPWLFSEWTTYATSMDDVDRLKLYHLALTRLIELPSPIQELTIQNLQAYHDLWETAFAEFRENGDEGADGTLWSQGEELEATEWDTPKSVVERKVGAKDPVHCVHGVEFVKIRMRDLVGRVGGWDAFVQQFGGQFEEHVMRRFQGLVQ